MTLSVLWSRGKDVKSGVGRGRGWGDEKKENGNSGGAFGGLVYWRSWPGSALLLPAVATRWQHF